MLSYAENFGRIEGVLRCTKNGLLTQKEALGQIQTIIDSLNPKEETDTTFIDDWNEGK